jgi:hypothetical protein
MAIVTIVLMPYLLACYDFIRQFICVGAFRNGRMGVNGEPDEDGGADDRPPDEKISCCLFLHKEPPSNGLKIDRLDTIHLKSP